MDPNVLQSEKLGIVGTIDPAVHTASYSDYVDMSKFEQIIAILLLGDMDAHTIDFAVYGYSDEAASDETEIASTTQLAASATANDNDQLVICVRNEHFRSKSNSAGKELRYARAKITSTSQTGYCAAVVLAGHARQGMEVTHDLASVLEVEDDMT